MNDLEEDGFEAEVITIGTADIGKTLMKDVPKR